MRVCDYCGGEFDAADMTGDYCHGCAGELFDDPNAELNRASMVAPPEGDDALLPPGSA